MLLLLQRYIQISKKDLHYIIVGLLSGTLASYYGVYVSENMSNILQGDFSNQRLYALCYSSFFTIITTSLRGACFTYAQKQLNHHLSIIIYNKLLNQDLQFYQSTPVNTILERVTNDVRIVSEMISLNLNVVSRSFISIVITFWLLTRISYTLTLVVIISIPVQYGITKIYEIMHERIMKGHEDVNKLLNTYVHETTSHITVVKTFGAEELTNNKHIHLRHACASYHKKDSALYGINLFVIMNLPTVITIIVIMSAKYMNISIGLTTFILHNQGLYGTIKTFIDYKNDYIKCKEPFQRIIEILDSKPPEQGYYIPETQTIEGKITFENIDFKYQSAQLPVLQNFNFEIKANDKIAIIGPSGCGKSTIAKLLIGLLRPCTGSIYIDDILINNYDNMWMKHKIGYVAQDSVLFADTIANNIAYGLSESQYTEKHIIAAAKKAAAHDFIMKLPHKYQTKLEGTELSSLSGGQRQRITIARALVRNPKIIIFDEATSALDPYCEEVVQNTIKECFNNQHDLSATMIIIAHRRSALEIADKIYRLEDSKLVFQEKDFEYIHK
jgi:subfamily B ATP-binding cassette protein MsbA